MKVFDVKTIEEVKMIIENEFKDTFKKYEYVDVIDSKFRILYEDVVANENIPEFDKSTVDGYALNYSNILGSSDSMPILLDLVAKINIGEEVKFELKEGECAYIPTGAMLPKGANAVVMIEKTEKIDENVIAFYSPVMFNENVIQKSDDMKIGQKVLSKGTLIRVESIGALVSLGIKKIKVYKKPVISIISTGDELIDLNKEIKLGQIRDINTYTLRELSKEYGLEIYDIAVLKDDRELITSTLEKFHKNSDIVVISGGSSMGEMDMTADIIDKLASPGILVHGMAIKPGKPTIVSNANSKVIFGLPGHPVSAIVVFKILIKTLLERAYGFEVKVENEVLAEALYNMPSAPGRETYQMGVIEKKGEHHYFKPSYGASGMITLLTNSNGYTIIPIDKEGIVKGEKIKAYYF